MIKGGTAQVQVARELGIDVATVTSWLARDRLETLENRAGRDRNSTSSQVAKNVIAKASSEAPSHKEAVKEICFAAVPSIQVDRPRCLKTSLNLKSLKLGMNHHGLPWIRSAGLWMSPKPTKTGPLWTGSLLFSGEAPFELFQAPNDQKDRV